MGNSKVPALFSASGIMCAALSTLALISLASCKPTETTVDRSLEPAEVPYGTRIVFGKGGNSEPYKVSGWSTTEEKFTWSEGTAAELRIPVVATDNIIVLKMRIGGLFKSPELPSQPVEIQINGQKIAEWQVGDTAEFVAAIPHDLTKLGGVLTINFKTPKATSPKALGLSADPRILGICCFDLELAKG